MSIGVKRVAAVLACAAGLMLGACGGAATEDAQGAPVATQESAIIVGGSEVSQVYYSDSTYTVQVGWALTKCDGTYKLEGYRTQYVRTAVYHC
ncbi:hypothetical protein DRW03_01515 [Corallococcus sp. H22C18031201]|uniref:hypothetical protein n=1 Tax=Citreicoccus inhibens TaxID=2849499 RepID=UPI000E74B033|nr:hypothetical protein [Citreicoccus inhibens]MBU8894920.1 hypothetical protein [Citreicoccus inhibens]RJS27085.1 hypothetical protein DRW03_01515 [Corallococcus sp. H22C18031201]